MKINVKLLTNDKEFMPQIMSKKAVGADLKACINEDIIIKSMNTAVVGTGISIELPEKYEAQIRPRSGLAFKNSITVLNTPGTIDPDYRGEIKVILINLGKQDFVVKRGMRIAQMIINKVEIPCFEIVDDLSVTDRGHGGFGHTGI
ncbi:MAG: dUTP diphosphatase [Candidatus Muirbacterium halophilum]|nr:dUTP diphosphatase [Candidatus Muirbacterium halophilum]MCK9477425.1 dUTP diphosphatase [Candidatus Muirbacterium halophilum]